MKLTKQQKYWQEHYKSTGNEHRLKCIIDTLAKIKEREKKLTEIAKHVCTSNYIGERIYKVTDEMSERNN